jgi:hypothetical protein
MNMNKDKLNDMSCQQLGIVYDALRAAEDAVAGIYHEPRCVDDRITTNFISDVLENLHDEIQNLADLATAKVGSVGEDAQHRSVLLIKHEIFCGGDLPRIASLASKVRP